MKTPNPSKSSRPPKGTTPWPLLAQEGFGLIEVLMAILVFVLLVYVGTRAFHGVVNNHKAANQINSVNDLVTATAEELSSIGVAVLTQKGSAFLKWSEPAAVGKGPMHYRYRIVPKPNIGPGPDSLLAGLQLEAGNMEEGSFVANRSFAALIAPHMASLNADGEVSTEQERELEADFYAALRKQIQETLKESPQLSAAYVNSYSCYDKGECCDYMRKYMANPDLNPKDGLDQKCHYRCAMAGDVPMADWKKACGSDFCSLAPWKNQGDCCAAINEGHCPPGSFCAQVCVGCVGEDGSSCPLPKCDNKEWNDLFDCQAGTFCDGSPLPDGDVPGWGYVKGICKLPTCQTLTNDCAEWRPKLCCSGYWSKIAAGETPDKEMEVCATISKQSECCSLPADQGYWNFQCDGNGNLIGMERGGTWYCPEADWNKYCRIHRGCAAPYIAPNFPQNGASCAPLSFNLPETPYQNPTPSTNTSTSPKPRTNQGNQVTPAPNSPASLGTGKGNSRQSSNRQGGGFNSKGGRE